MNIQHTFPIREKRSCTYVLLYTCLSLAFAYGYTADVQSYKVFMGYDSVLDIDMDIFVQINVY